MEKFTPLLLENLLGVVVQNSWGYIDEVFAALKSGKVVVPLRDKDDEQRISATNLSELVCPTIEKGWKDLNFGFESHEGPAQISFTSGTEGVPKGVILSHAALSDTVNRLVDVSDIDGTAREYIGVPVYHSFGYGRCRVLGKVGGRGFIPSNGFDPIEFGRMLESNEVNALSAVPSLIRLILEMGEKFKSYGDRLQWIEIGSQPMSYDEKLKLKALFPRANIVQHYGLTEASRSTFLKVHAEEDALISSVGKAYGDTEISISDSGRIRIKGPHVASGLLVEGKLCNLVDESGWFETSDLGELINGYLYFKGRADNLINCGGQKILAESLEKLLFEHFTLSGGLAVARIPDKSYGDAVLVAYDNSFEHPEKQLIDVTKSLLSEAGIQASGALKTYSMSHIPTTDTGKVKRNELVTTYLSTAQKNHSIDEATTSKIADLFCSKLEGVKIEEADSINSLGLDSVQVVVISIGLEKILGAIPSDYRTLTIKQLSQLENNIENLLISSENEDLKQIKIPGSTNENPKNISFWSLVKEDYQTNDATLFSQGFWAIFCHRFGNARMSVKTKLLRAPLSLFYRFFVYSVQIFCGIKLDYTVKLGRRVKLEHFGGMILGARAIADDVTIRQNTTMGIKDLSNLSGKPTIERGVNIGAGAVIVGDITIGRYSVIGPNSVVDSDIPPFSSVSAVASTIVKLGESQ